jgi:hypothetical protein
MKPVNAARTKMYSSRTIIGVRAPRG